MKKNMLILGTLLYSTITFSQIGINTEAPKATLDVKAFPLNLNKTDGIIAPRLTREELTNKGNTLYGNDQKGAIVYITDVSAGDASSQRTNMTATGYYYFDGTLWQKLAPGAGTASAGEPWYIQGTMNAAQSGNHQNIYQLGSVAIGKNTAYSSVKLDIAGAMRGGNAQQGIIGDNSIAFGNGNEASGSNTAAIGLANKARGNQSFALGHEAETAEGATTSIAMGYRAKAKGPDAVAFGNGSVASGQGSFAMGINITTASGSGSFAGGNGSAAQGNNSIALGHNVIASGTSSTAFGANTMAGGSFSFVQGYGSQAHDQSQAVLGQWNQPIVNDGLQEIFTIGNGNTSSQRGNLIVGIKGGVPEDGWVAIGSAGNTTLSRSKNEKLRVWGNIAATGQLFAGIQTVGSYPDYVFEKYFQGASGSNKEYTFKTLYETEKFIKENQHLPGVTSIRELTENGSGGYIFSVSDLSLQSLEKVEELYLHTIEQQKQIDELKMLLQIQQHQIDKLVAKQN